jgi:transcriptional regulator with XRE-family HTH domain
MIQIKKQREKNRLSQVQLAQKLGVNQNTVSQWETGRSSPPVDKLIIMSDLFGCTIDELVRGEKK